MTKDSRVNLRLTPEQKGLIQIHAKECGMSLSRYILFRSLQAEQQVEYEDRETIRLLLKIGNNINQVAKQLYLYKTSPNMIKILDAECKNLDYCIADIMNTNREFKKQIKENLNIFSKWKNTELKLLQKQNETAAIVQNFKRWRKTHDIKSINRKKKS